MKIDVVYEKQDILRLVVEDLKKRGISVKEGHVPAYKGALEIKLAVDAEDSVAAPQEEAPPPPKKGKAKAAEAEEEVDMTAIMRQSKNLVMNARGKFENATPRPLGTNESYDYPGE